MLNSAGEQGRETGSGPRRGLLAWFIWVLASALGGAVAGSVSEPLEIVGYLLLPGAVLGAAQALVLRRYLSYPPTESNLVALTWVGASFTGWFAGWVVFAFVQALLGLTGAPEIAQQASDTIDQLAGSVNASVRIVQIVAWTSFAAFQGAALALVALALGPRRTLLPLAALWVSTGVLGGLLAVAAGSVINYAVLPPGGPNLFLDRMVPTAVAEAASWALYGAVTGVVLAIIVRRSESQEDSAYSSTHKG